MVTGVSPSNGSAGDTVTITGTGFGNGSWNVTIGGIAVSGIPSWADTSISVIVPIGVGLGWNVSVVNAANKTNIPLPSSTFSYNGNIPNINSM